MTTEGLASTRFMDGWLRLPVSGLQQRPAVQDWVAKVIWLSIPLQTIALSYIPGGLEFGNLVPAILFTLLAVLALLAIAAGAALVEGGIRGYAASARGNVVALLLTWSMALLLLDLSYWVGSVAGMGIDIVGAYLCEGCAAYPGLNWGTASVYLLYGTCGALTVRYVLLSLYKLVPEQGERGQSVDPRILVIVGCTALVLTVTNSLSH